MTTQQVAHTPGRQDEDQFIPGNYRCGQCGFVLVKSVLSVAHGAIYANTRQDYELCPNDGGPMRPVTWREGYEEGCKMQAELLGSRTELLETLKHAKEFILYGRLPGDDNSKFADSYADEKREFVLKRLAAAISKTETGQ